MSLEAVLAQEDAYSVVAVDVRQPYVHDHEIDPSNLGGLNALSAAPHRSNFKLLVHQQLLRHRLA